MSYADFQKKHPHWPTKMSDLKGYKVRLLERVVTGGGEVYEAGEVFRVYGSYRGRLHLDSLSRTDGFGNFKGIRHLPPRMVELCE